MKRTLQKFSNIVSHAMSAIPSLTGRGRMGLLLALVAIMMPIGAWAQEETANDVVSVTIDGETTYYTSIKDAVAKANESDNATITLLQDATTGERLDFAKSATLDLNGNTLSCTAYFADDYETMVAITTNGAKLMIIDSIGGGKLDGTGTTFVLLLGCPGAVGLTVTSSVHISGGTVSGAVRMVEGTSMTVSGGTVERNAAASTIHIYTNATLNVSGGQILNTYSSSSAYAIINEGTLNITGGTVSGSIGVRNSNSGTANISGNANITGTERSVVSNTDDEGALTITGGSYTGGINITGGTATIGGGRYTGGIVVSGGTATISGGTITESSAENAVEVSGSAELIISDGTFSATAGETYDTGVYVHDGGTVKIAGGTITSTAYGVYNERGSATITGGSISGGTVDLYVGGNDGILNLTLDEGKTVGATFPGGITLEAVGDPVCGTLAELLATDAATYWGVVDGKNTMLTVADDAAAITDKGDITIRTICDHSDSEHTTAIDNGNGTHDVACAVCNGTVAEVHTYDETGFCIVCGALNPNATEVVITDGAHSTFSVPSDMALETLTYVRTLPNLTWNALYVPFEIPFSELADNYDVAYINDIRSYDTDDNGEIDDMTMEIIRINSGTLHANHPYLIRAKSEAAREMSLTLTNATLCKTEEKSFTCSSMYMDFKVTGSYTSLTADELEGKYAVSTEGAWQHLNPGTTLKPFRLYMEMTARDGSPVKVEEAGLVYSRIRIVVRGEAGGATGIEAVGAPRTAGNGILYDLSGRRVTTPVKGGIYIRDGKKVVEK